MTTNTHTRIPFTDDQLQVLSDTIRLLSRTGYTDAAKALIRIESNEIDVRARMRVSREHADYELHNYKGSSEIRAVYSDRPEEIIAEFPTQEEAHQAWGMMMEALTYDVYFGRLHNEGSL